jgi:3-hydroxyacyl-[acyl-carrier-protein] dehydratase
LVLDLEQIKTLLPHRDPFLLIDEVVDLVPGERGVGRLHVQADAFWVRGHFPHEPIMPGVLIAEALAQVAGVVVLSKNEENAGGSLYLVGLDRFRFRKPVRPGDVLELEVSVSQQRRGVCRFKAVARVGGVKVADGELMAAAG